MPRPWSEERKKRFTALRAAGKTPGEIAKALGLPREKVIERIEDLQTKKRNAAIVEAGWKKRAQVREARAQAAIREMAKAIKRGADRNAAMLKAYESGATWREIGEQLGITTAAANQGGRTARVRRGRPSPNLQGLKWRGRIADR
jgi:DNA-directed RNA polymerase specialized sigma subunit